MLIEGIEIDDHILEKLLIKHGVTFDEVEEACLSDERRIRRGRDGLFQVYGRTDAGRYLLVILAGRAEGHWKVVTARNMTASERRQFRRL